MSGFNSFLGKGHEDREKPVDMIWLLRGGATDVYTVISNLSRLQQKFPNDHLSSTLPYILADSAGAYPGSGLAADNPVDPIELPALFQRNIGRYLSKDRTEAEGALKEDLGDMRVQDSNIPIAISTTEITDRLHRTYFRHFPERFAQSHPGMELPSTSNGHVPMTKAVLASSAFAAFLGDYKIEDRRFMDMAFLETHSANLAEFAMNHARACPDRRLICVIFGNNYSRISISPEQKISLPGLKRHFGDAIRAYVHDDIIGLANALFKPENVFDLSIYVDQPFHARNQAPLPHAFRSDDLAIRERVAWTDGIIDRNQHHKETLERLTDVIRRGSIPYARAQVTPHKHADLTSRSDTHVPLTATERLISALQDYNIPAGMAVAIVREVMKPIIKTAGTGLHYAASMLAYQWQRSAPWRDEQIDSALRKLLPNHPVDSSALKTDTNPLRLPSQRHS